VGHWRGHSSLRQLWLSRDNLLFLDPDSDWSWCGEGGGGHLEARHCGLGLEVKLSLLLLLTEAFKQRRDVHRGQGGELLGERDRGQGQAEQQTLLHNI